MGSHHGGGHHGSHHHSHHSSHHCSHHSSHHYSSHGHHTTLTPEFKAKYGNVGSITTNGVTIPMIPEFLVFASKGVRGEYGSKPYGVYEHNGLWYDPDSKAHGYNMDDDELRKRAKNFLDDPNNPKFTFSRYSHIFLICLIFYYMCFAFTNLTYEILIIPFEFINMSDGTFAFIDNFIYYGQWVIPILWYVINEVFKDSRVVNIRYELVKETVEYYRTAGNNPVMTEEEVKLVTCPNCGANTKDNADVCEFCGSPIRVYKSNVDLTKDTRNLISPSPVSEPLNSENNVFDSVNSDPETSEYVKMFAKGDTENTISEVNNSYSDVTYPSDSSTVNPYFDMNKPLGSGSLNSGTGDTNNYEE